MNVSEHTLILVTKVQSENFKSFWLMRVKQFETYWTQTLQYPEPFMNINHIIEIESSKF